MTVTPLTAGTFLIGPFVGWAIWRMSGWVTPSGLVGAAERSQPAGVAIVSVVVAATLIPIVSMLAMEARWAALCSVYGWLLLAASTVDLRTLRAPHLLSFAVFAAGVASASAFGPPRAWVDAIVAGVGATLLLTLARVGFQASKGRAGMGGGDPGLFGAAAAWLGPVAAPWALVGAAGLALAAMLATRRLANRPTAFAPFVALAGFIAALVASQRTGAPFWSPGLFGGG